MLVECALHVQVKKILIAKICVYLGNISNLVVKQEMCSRILKYTKSYNINNIFEQL